jgi:8-oxo-dGTP diphosphatase
MESTAQKVIAVGLIRNDKGKVLVQKRVDPLVLDANGKWEFPGGLIEFGETPEAAVIRECKEETNCAVEVIRFLPLSYSKVWKKTDGTALQAFVWFFELRYVSGDPKPVDPKVSEVMWVTKEEALELDSLPGLKESIEYID